MRTGSAKVRLLALTIAVAIAVPSNLPTWAADDDAAPSPAARADGGSPGKAVLNRVASRASWHGAGFACADPSDEPDEGSDGWVPAHGVGLPASDVPPGPVADGRPEMRPAPAQPPLSAGALGRLRC